MNPGERIQELIQKSGLWTLSNDGFDVWVTNNLGTSSVTFVSNSDLKLIDNKLPSAIRVLLQDDKRVDGPFIAEVLKLRDVDIHFEDDNGLVAFTNVDSMLISETSVTIAGDGCEYLELELPDLKDMMLIPIFTQDITFTLATEWLDKRNPDWRKLHDIADSFDLGFTEVIREILKGPVVDKDKPIVEAPTDVSPEM